MKWSWKIMNHILSDILDEDIDVLNKLEKDLSNIINNEILNILKNNNNFNYNERELIEYYVSNKKTIINTIAEKYIEESGTKIPYETLKNIIIRLSEIILPVDKYKNENNTVVISMGYNESIDFFLKKFNDKRKELNINHYEFFKKLRDGFMKDILINEYNVNLEDLQTYDIYKTAINKFEYLYEDEIKKEKEEILKQEQVNDIVLKQKAEKMSKNSTKKKKKRKLVV